MGNEILRCAQNDKGEFTMHRWMQNDKGEFTIAKGEFTMHRWIQMAGVQGDGTDRHFSPLTSSIVIMRLPGKYVGVNVQQTAPTATSRASACI